MPHLLESIPRLESWMAEHGEPAYRAGQVRRWLFEQRVGDWEEMTNLPSSLRAALAAEFSIWTTTTVRHSTADDGTEKLLLSLADKRQVECVLIRDVRDERARRTFCISTQVGCGMGCVFCASGLDGVERNLTTGEITEQMLQLQRLLKVDERLSHIVVMGMGEPLANLDALLPSLEIANDPEGLGVSARRITISTVGLPKAIDRLATECPKYRLAVSLHAPNDALRNQLVPVNSKIGLDAIFAAADRYFEESSRRLTFEYVLLAGVNDQPDHARQLAKRLAGRTALLNVIPYNPVAGLPYQTPSEDAQRTFQRILTDAGIAIQFRRRKGNRIDAACGQLRRQAIVEMC